MHPFNEKATCPKCGAATVRAWWVAANQFPYHGLGRCTELREHIHRACDRCHFEWLEAPLDARAPGGDQGGGER